MGSNVRSQVKENVVHLMPVSFFFYKEYVIN